MDEGQQGVRASEVLAEVWSGGVRPDGLEPPEFTLLTDFEWFLAEYASVKDHLVVHFFPKANGKSDREAFWGKTFGELVSEHAIRIFKAEQPQLTLQYFEVGGLVPHALSEEGVGGYPSWCFVARGFGGLYATSLVSLLCEAVEAAANQSSM